MTPEGARPFRFIAAMPPLRSSVPEWRDGLRRIEDLGYDSISVSEHLAEGWLLEATSAMLAIADATQRIRILSLVLSNDLRHPAMLHKVAASIDLLSGGRLELGLGTGWLADDARAIGLDGASGGDRIERLDETLEILDRLFTQDAAVSFHGRHHRVDGLRGEPRPVQQPRPPILIGGGGPRILDLAGRRADIVGVHCRLPSGAIDAAAIDEFQAETLAGKVERVRSSARAAGRDPQRLELQFTAYVTHVGDGAVRPTSALGQRIVNDPRLAGGTPAAITGPVEACVDQLEEWRERLGFSYWKLGSDPQATAPIVKQLRGR